MSEQEAKNAEEQAQQQESELNDEELEQAAGGLSIAMPLPTKPIPTAPPWTSPEVCPTSTVSFVCGPKTTALTCQ